MKRAGILTAAIAAAVVFFLLVTLPPKPARTNVAANPELMWRTVSGAYHIHSTRSDGAADKDTIAAAASRAGLAFIILTDHGDGMRTPDPPAYLHGVLCLDAVEISTNGGHYVALDMQPAPYPLGGEPSAVVEDVKRLGGFGIVAHPDSPKPELAWKDWDAPFDGIEWLSADSEWRDESRARLGRILFDYLLRPGPALASLLDRPVATFKRWDELIQRRPVVGLAGVDAHGGIGRGMEEGGKRRPALGTIPSYEASFRTFTTRAILERPFSGDAAADARALMASIRSGRVFTLIDAIAAPGFVDVESDGARPSVDYGIGDGAECIGLEPVGAAQIMERIDHDGHAVVLKNAGVVTAHLRRNHVLGMTVVTLACDVQRVVIEEHPQLRRLGRGRAFARILLDEVACRRDDLVRLVIEFAVDDEWPRDARGRDHAVGSGPGRGSTVRRLARGGRRRHEQRDQPWREPIHRVIVSGAGAH